MAQETRQEKKERVSNLVAPPKIQNKEEGKIIRIMSKDIEGNMNVYPGLTRIKGISWGISNAVCRILKIEKNRKIGSLTEGEIKKISEFIKEMKFPVFLVNRRFDFEDGTNKHLSGSDLELRKDFDIKRLKKIKSYKGLRHQLGLPVRGQRTQSHFRVKRMKGVGIKKKVKGEVKNEGKK